MTTPEESWPDATTRQLPRTSPSSRAEEERRDSWSELEVILRGIADGVTAQDTTGRVIYANDAAARMLGYPSARAFLETPLQEVMQKFEVLDESGSPFRLEDLPGRRALRDRERAEEILCFRILATGEERWSAVRAMPVFDEAGQVRMAVNIFHDVTERKLDKTMRARLAAIVESSSDAIIGKNLDGIITSWNAGAERIYGYSSREAVGEPISMLAPPERADEIPQILARIRRGEKVDEYETVRVTKDGRRLNISLTVSPIKDATGTIVGASTIARDITKRKRREEQLREKEAQYRNVFEATGDGLIITDLDGNLVDANPAFCSMHSYDSCAELVGRHVTSWIHPDYHELSEEYAATIRAGGQLQAQAVNIRKDGTSFPVEIHGSAFTYRGELHALLVVRDVTERARAYELLERRVEERTRELSTLLEVSRNVASTLELEPLLSLILDQLKTVVDYTDSSLLVFEGDELVTVCYRGRVPQQQIMGTRFPPGRGRMMLEGPGHMLEPIFIDDVWSDAPEAVAYREVVGEEYLRRVFGHIRSWLGIPLVLKGDPIGLLVLLHKEQGYYAEWHAEVGGTIANQAAIAIENARLFKSLRERTRELSSLLEISKNVASTLELEPLLGLVLEELGTVVNYVDASVFIEDSGDLVAVGHRGSVSEEHVLGTRYPREAEAAVWQGLDPLEPVIIEDIHDDTPTARAYQRIAGQRRLGAELARVRSWMGVPLVHKERFIGLLILVHDEPDHYTTRHAELARTIANQAAVAIENARLYERAQSMAALEERQRLARELHDSVSQALYGIVLGTDAAETLLDRDPTRLAEPLKYLRSLAEAGLAEMRALIFELRPESLENEGLVAALEKQGASLRARHGIEVHATLCDEPNVPLRVKETLYRIAQEALHNTVKHAQASNMDLKLECGANGVTLKIHDDGVGFDPAESFPGHLGLTSMRERAERLDGTFEVESTPGKGTRILVRIPSDKWTKTPLDARKMPTA